MTKAAAAINDLMNRVHEILAEEEYSDFMLERVYRIKEDIIDPVVRTLGEDPAHVKTIERLTSLHRAVEEYVVMFQHEPERRDARRKQIEGIRTLVRRDLLSGQDIEGEVEQLLDDIRKWQWRTTLDERGRLVFTTASGAVVPARAVIAERVGDQVIAQAVKAQQPYSDNVRPRNVRGDPGGLIVIEEGKRAIVVGDLHGRYDNLEHILKDKDNLASILLGYTHLIFTGDAIHPRSSAMNSPEAYEDSFCVMLLIMTLKAENPFNVHYLIGNHDNAHIGGRPAGRGQVRQDRLFEKFVTEKFGQNVFEGYCKFVESSPIAAKVTAPNGHVLLVHAGLTPRVLSPQGLINILVKGRQGIELQELLWSRNYDRETLQKCLENVGARFIIAGHTNPTQSRAARYGIEIMAEDVFAHVHRLQVILNAQKNVFGYLDFDMTRPLPDDVTDLAAPDGHSAFRALRPRRPAENNADSQ